MKKMMTLSFVFAMVGCATQMPTVGDPSDPMTPGGGDDGDDGGDDDPMNPGDPAGLTPASFIEKLVARDCHEAFSCKASYTPEEAGDTFADDWGATEAACLGEDDDYASRAQIAAAVTGGTITFDAQIAANCLANAAYPACTAFFTTYEWPDSCYDALSGNVADGGACTTGWECGDTSDCITGTCAPAPADE